MGCTQSKPDAASAPESEPSIDIRPSESESGDVFDASPTASAPMRGFERIKSSNSFRNSKNSPSFTKPREVRGKDNQILQFIHQISGTITSEPVSKLTTPKFQRRSFSGDTSDAVAALSASDTPALPTSHSQPTLHSSAADEVSDLKVRRMSSGSQDKNPEPQGHVEDTIEQKDQPNESSEHDSYFQQDVASEASDAEPESTPTVTSPNNTQPSLAYNSSMSVSIPPESPQRMTLLADDRNVSPCTRKLTSQSSAESNSNHEATPPASVDVNALISTAEASRPETPHEETTPHDEAPEPQQDTAAPEENIVGEVPPVIQLESLTEPEPALPPLPPRDTPKSSPLIAKRSTSTPSLIPTPPLTTPTASPSPTNSDKQIKRRRSRNPVRELSSASVLSNVSGVSDSSKVTDTTDDGAAFMRETSAMAQKRRENMKKREQLAKAGPTNTAFTAARVPKRSKTPPREKATKKVVGPSRRKSTGMRGTSPAAPEGVTIKPKI